MTPRRSEHERLAEQRLATALHGLDREYAKALSHGLERQARIILNARTHAERRSLVWAKALMRMRFFARRSSSATAQLWASSIHIRWPDKFCRNLLRSSRSASA